MFSGILIERNSSRRKRVKSSLVFGRESRIDMRAVRRPFVRGFIAFSCSGSRSKNSLVSVLSVKSCPRKVEKEYSYKNEYRDE